MNHVTNEFISLPLWAQIMLVVIILFVGHYWLQFTSRGILSKLTNIDSRYWILLKWAFVSMMISYLIVTFWVGTDATNHVMPWGLWGRGAFVLSTVYLTTFMSRYGQK